MGKAAEKSASGPGKLRLVGGVWRRHQLPVAQVEGLRPSPDRLRETLFNWLGQTCQSYHVLDLFSGTGSLGLEAASRGAERVDFVESNVQIATQLKRNIDSLLGKWQVSYGARPVLKVHRAAADTALAHLSQCRRPFDLVFLDPPFGSDLLQSTLPLMRRILKPSGLVYLEWHTSLFDDLPALAQCFGLNELDALRHTQVGRVHGHLVGLPTL